MNRFEHHRLRRYPRRRVKVLPSSGYANSWALVARSEFDLIEIIRPGKTSAVLMRYSYLELLEGFVFLGQTRRRLRKTPKADRTPLAVTALRKRRSEISVRQKWVREVPPDIRSLALELCQSLERAWIMLTTPHPTFGNSSPLEIAKSSESGAKYVASYLVSAIHGIPA